MHHFLRDRERSPPKGEKDPLPRVGKIPSQGWESPSPSTTAPATGFWGVVTPVDVSNLYQALSNHPEKDFFNKFCSEFREGARIGFSGPRCSRFSNNLPTAYLNPEVVMGNPADKVFKGRNMGPFLPPPLNVFKISPLILFPKNIQTNSEQFSTNPSQSLGPLALIILSKRMISPSNITIDNAIAAIPGCYMAKNAIIKRTSKLIRHK